jgi:uncharacterized DUF497 family protein
MGLTFEWDAAKAAANAVKHGVTFGEASTAFGDPFSLTRPDLLHSDAEPRFILIGRTRRDRIVVVVHALPGENVRIITARPATASERIVYEEE